MDPDELGFGGAPPVDAGGMGTGGAAEDDPVAGDAGDGGSAGGESAEPGLGSGGQSGTGEPIGGAGGALDGGEGGGGADENAGAGGESSVPPPIVPIEVGACGAFTPCGGDLDGVWTYVEACVDPADLGIDEGALRQLCPGIDFELEGEVAGTLTFSEGRLTRQGASSARGTIAVPGLCALGLGGCAGVRRELLDAGLAGAVCTSGGGLFPSCNCAFGLVAPEIDGVQFETNGAVLSLSNGRTFEYCVEGDVLTQTETNGAVEPGVRRLERQ
jgi:hypothetical protein